jgi:hypothetical protein
MNFKTVLLKPIYLFFVSYLGATIGLVAYEMMQNNQTDVIYLIYQFNLIRFLALIIGSLCIPRIYWEFAVIAPLYLAYLIKPNWIKWLTVIIFIVFAVLSFSILDSIGPHWAT